MAIIPIPAERFEEVQRALRAEMAEKAPPILNLDAALSLGEAIPLLWDGVEYRVKAISYQEGLQLQRAALRLERLGKTREASLEEVETVAAFLGDTLALFHSLLDPKPPENPFADATPVEVGELLGFFSACLMRQGAQRRSRMAPHPRTTRSTH